MKYYKKIEIINYKTINETILPQRNYNIEGILLTFSFVILEA